MAERILNIHEQLDTPNSVEDIGLVKGRYEYYHYMCDGQNDRGWGCGYRTLQTMCSWIRLNVSPEGIMSSDPSIHEIQKILVDLGDKTESFYISREWIGSVEIAIVIDHLHDVPCKIIHVMSGSEIIDKANELLQHFKNKGSPVMIGGNTDAASKTLLGVCQTKDGHYKFLILDPHYVGVSDKTIIIQNGWIGWKSMDIFSNDSFYNFCLPQATFTYS